MTEYVFVRQCLFCGQSYPEADLADGWSAQPIGESKYWRCPTCTTEDVTEPIVSFYDAAFVRRIQEKADKFHAQMQRVIDGG